MTQAVIRHNPSFKQYYQKKRAEGMPYRKAVIATLNKLFRVIFALLKKNETFREEAITSCVTFSEGDQSLEVKGLSL
jgi:hypothetical protein